LKTRIEELKQQDPFEDPDRLKDNAASDTEANEEAGHERMTALITELEKSLTYVQTSLTRMNEGSYGICESCQKPIEAERLHVIPTAVLCFSCEGKKPVKPS